MGYLSYFVGSILPYITVVVFTAGFVYRIWTWIRAPVPLKIPVTPAPKTNSGVALRLATEVLTFRNMFAGDKKLWIGSWPFHAALALILIGHIRLFTGLIDKYILIGLFGLTEASIDKLAYVLGGSAGIVVLVAAIYLLIRRGVIPNVRYVTTFADYFALLLLLAIFTAGNYMRFFTHVDLLEIRGFLASLWTFSPAPPDNPVFIIHFFLVQVLLMYLPFSKLMHLGGIFFSPTLNQKDDPRERRYINPWDYPVD